MFIIENPIISLIIALCILIFFKLLFKILNFLENLNLQKKSKQKQQSSKTKETKDLTNKTNIEKESISNSLNKDSEKETKKDNLLNAKNSNIELENYLYDRFVSKPTNIDNLRTDTNYRDAFLKKNVVEAVIDRKNFENKNTINKSDVEKNIDKLSDLKNEKQKVIEEFNSMSKEMKLLIIENILQKLD